MCKLEINVITYWLVMIPTHRMMEKRSLSFSNNERQTFLYILSVKWSFRFSILSSRSEDFLLFCIDWIRKEIRLTYCSHFVVPSTLAFIWCMVATKANGFCIWMILFFQFILFSPSFHLLPSLFVSSSRFSSSCSNSLYSYLNTYFFTGNCRTCLRSYL